MQVIVRIDSHWQNGQTVSFGDGQRLCVGRSRQVDLSVPCDPYLQDSHFELAADQDQCVLRQVHPRTTTYVNEKLVGSECKLIHGDVIQAGRTKFRIMLETDAGGKSNIRSSKATRFQSAKTSHFTELKESDIPASIPIPIPAPSSDTTPTQDTFLAVIEFESEFGNARKVWLAENQSLLVGGSEWSDFSVCGDPSLSDIHFAFETSARICRVRDMESETGVRVNGQVVSDREVYDGDLIHAGCSRFRVHIRSGSSKTGASARESTASDSTDQAYRTERCASGLRRFFDGGRGTKCREMASRLAERLPMYLVANFGTAGVPVPDGLGDLNDLLLDASDSSLTRRKLMMIAPDDEADRFQLLDELLGHDAVCCVYSAEPRETVVETLRAAAVSYSSPSVLDGQLSSCPRQFCRSLLLNVDALLIESPTRCGWTIYGDPPV